MKSDEGRHFVTWVQVPYSSCLVRDLESLESGSDGRHSECVGTFVYKCGREINIKPEVCCVLFPIVLYTDQQLVAFIVATTARYGNPLMRNIGFQR